MKRYTLMVMAMVLLAVSSPAMATDTPPGTAAQTAPAAENSNCPKPPGTPVEAIFSGLKSVSLLIRVTPTSFIEAVECHGKEEECAAQQYTIPSEVSESEGDALHEEFRRFRKRAADDQRLLYIKNLKADYNIFPASLYPNVLKSKFEARVRAKILPFLTHDISHCATQDILVFEGGGWEQQKKIDETVATKGNLTVYVDLRAASFKGQKAALLTYGYYRPDVIGIPKTAVTVIPLDQDDTEIAKQLDSFISGIKVEIEDILKY